MECSFIIGSLLAWLYLAPLVPEFLSLLSTDAGVIFGALLGLHGSLLGFVLAALTIIMGYSSSPQLRVLRDAGQLPNLFLVYLAGVRASAVAAVFSLLAMLAAGGTPIAEGLAWAVALTTALSLGRLARTLWITKNVVSKVGETLNRPAGQKA